MSACLEAGANLNARLEHGGIPLHYAAAFSQPAAVAALLAAGADPNARDGVEQTPLHWAAWRNRNPSVVRVLLDAGADPALKHKKGRTALEVAIRYEQRPETIAALRAATTAGSTSQSDCTGWSAEDLGLRSTFYRNLTPATVVACLDGAADLHAPDGRFGGTPLHWAAVFSQPAAVAALLAAGADPARTNDGGKTPLELAVSEGRPAEVIAALEAGAER